MIKVKKAKVHLKGAQAEILSEFTCLCIGIIHKFDAETVDCVVNMAKEQFAMGKAFKIMEIKK